MKMTEKELKAYRARSRSRQKLLLELTQAQVLRLRGALQDIKLRLDRGYFSLSPEDRELLQRIANDGLRVEDL
jgi:hypothetical protein